MGKWVTVQTTFNGTSTPRYTEGERRWVADDAEAQKLHDKGWAKLEDQTAEEISAPAEVTLEINTAGHGQTTTEV